MHPGQAQRGWPAHRFQQAQRGAFALTGQQVQRGGGKGGGWHDESGITLGSHPKFPQFCGQWLFLQRNFADAPKRRGSV